MAINGGRWLFGSAATTRVVATAVHVGSAGAVLGLRRAWWRGCTPAYVSSVQATMRDSALSPNVSRRANVMDAWLMMLNQTALIVDLAAGTQVPAMTPLGN